MSLDYYLVRHDRKALFELGTSHGYWSKIFPITGGRPNKVIQRFGKHLLKTLPNRIALENPDLPVEDRIELVWRIRGWAAGAAGIYCINDDSDQWSFCHQEQYKVTGTFERRRVGEWWLAPVTSHVLAHHAGDDFHFGMKFAGEAEARKVFNELTEEDLVAARAQNQSPRQARA